MAMAEWIPLHQLLGPARPDRWIGGAGADRIDHAGLLARVAAWRVAFSQAGGRDWALYFDDSLAFAAALLGAWSAGKRVYLPSDNLPATLQALRPQVDGVAGDVDLHWQPLAPSAVGADAIAPVMLDERACRLVVFTSGSTGAPVAIEKRLDQLACEVGALEQAFGALLEGAQVHGTVSHQHIYGLLFRVLWPLSAGRAILPRRFFHEDLVAALSTGPSVLVATPAHLKRLPAQLDWRAARTHLRAVFSSGGPLPAQAAVDVRALLDRVPIEVFGSSETGGIAWRGGDASTSAWQPLPGVQWRIDDGQLSVASAHLPDGGWWRSEDRAEADAQGGFRLLGRADRIVKVEERRVSLDALEHALRAHPAVADVRVLLLPGQREQLAAVVVPRDTRLLQADEAGRRAAGRQLSNALADAHDAVARPRRWRFVDALPLNAQGKTTQAALLSLFQPEQPEPVDLPPVQWLQRGPASASAQLTLQPDLRAFDGHFPGVPVLPGVAQVDWAIRFAQTVFALPARFVRIDALKFQRVARPGDTLLLQLDWDASRRMLAFRFSSGHGIHASGKVVFADAD